MNVLLVAALSLAASLPAAPRLTVAAAANLTGVCAEAAQAFTKKTGIEVVCSYGSTAQLAQQLANGAPFDLFASADAEHVDSSIANGALAASSRAVYARGQLALWAPKGAELGLKDIAGLTAKRIRYIAIANPELAPYGLASVEALKAAGLWEQIREKAVYPSSINQAKQLAASGNADVAFTAYSLVLHETGTVIKVDPKLYRPIQQALGVASRSPYAREAWQFREFLLGPEGQSILARNGYLAP
jgi:molybdate transport system substrate-binding protein